MLKHWKKESWGISLAWILGICLVAGLTFYLKQTAWEGQSDYKPHLMVEDTCYWLSTGPTVPELPAGYTEFAKVESELPAGRAETNGQANGFAAGTPLYRSEAQPGWLYLPNADGSWTRLTVIDLQKNFLRCEGKLYLDELSVPYEMDVSISFDPETLISTGETLTWIGHEIIPLEDCTTNDSFCSGGEVMTDPEQPDILVIRLPRAQNGKVDYCPFVTAASLGLDYTVYEWSD